MKEREEREEAWVGHGGGRRYMREEGRKGGGGGGMDGSGWRGRMKEREEREEAWVGHGGGRRYEGGGTRGRRKRRDVWVRVETREGGGRREKEEVHSLRRVLSMPGPSLVRVCLRDVCSLFTWCMCGRWMFGWDGMGYWQGQGKVKFSI